jgi:sensor c-di-GMP phosphodiesterase-like protein
MMKKSTALFLTMIAAVAAVVFPILFAVHVAKDEALEAEQQRALVLARDVLVRAEITASEAVAGVQTLKQAAGDDPCSEQNVALMRRLDLRSSKFQAIGYMSANRLVCSSLGAEAAGVDLGPPDVVRPNGVKMRNGVVFPFAPATPFIVMEYEHYAAVINKDTGFVATSVGEPASLALVGVPERQVLGARGAVSSAWTSPLPPGQHVTSVEGPFVVAKVVSPHYHLMAVSAIPIGFLNARVQLWTRVLVPIGFLVGILLALLIFYIVRVRLALPTVIKAGLKRDEFFVHYQPIVDLRSGRWVGAEALIRWRRRGEVISPDDFIGVAEANGLITLITARVVQLVRRDAAALFASRPDFHIGINLAPADLHDERTVALLRRLLDEIEAVPGNVMVEATERGFTDPASAGPVIRGLRACGIRVAIDDFGTGYSSLASLQSLDVDYLKIDKAFVNTLGTDAATGTVALHIIEMAKALNLEMIAEGVTTEAQAASLREQGVQYAQGWLFAKPMPFDELVAALERRDEPNSMVLGVE